MRTALARHWPEYLMEAAALGLFMVSACVFGTLLGHPASPIVRRLPDPLVRQAAMGVLMGLTAVAIIHSPWGKQSGAHMNPAVTLTFLRLGKVRPWDAGFYVLAQFAGGLLGVLGSAALLRGRLAHPDVRYVVTVPGGGALVAFGAELAISFGMMLAILVVSNSAWERATGLVAGLLVAAYITFEAPLSGMSMNPARTLGSAVPAMTWTSLWIYFVAPPLGMLAAAELYRGARRTAHCAKLHHANTRRCIFCQDVAAPRASHTTSSAA
jgi:aquaporin Z